MIVSFPFVFLIKIKWVIRVYVIKIGQVEVLFKVHFVVYVILQWSDELSFIYVLYIKMELKCRCLIKANGGDCNFHCEIYSFWYFSISSVLKHRWSHYRQVYDEQVEMGDDRFDILGSREMSGLGG